MALDPSNVMLDQLEKLDQLAYPRRVVARYPRAVVIEMDMPGRDPSYTVYALIDADTGPYDAPQVIWGLSKDSAMQMARDWTRP
jgi:hypothetical protein